MSSLSYMEAIVSISTYEIERRSEKKDEQVIARAGGFVLLSATNPQTTTPKLNTPFSTISNRWFLVKSCDLTNLHNF